MGCRLGRLDEVRRTEEEDWREGKRRILEGRFEESGRVCSSGVLDCLIRVRFPRCWSEEEGRGRERSEGRGRDLSLVEKACERGVSIEEGGSSDRCIER